MYQVPMSCSACQNTVAHSAPSQTSVTLSGSAVSSMKPSVKTMKLMTAEPMTAISVTLAPPRTTVATVLSTVVATVGTPSRKMKATVRAYLYQKLGHLTNGMFQTEFIAFCAESPMPNAP